MKIVTVMIISEFRVEIDMRPNNKKWKMPLILTVALLIIVYFGAVTFFNYIHSQPVDYEADELKAIINNSK